MAILSFKQFFNHPIGNAASSNKMSQSQDKQENRMIQCRTATKHLITNVKWEERAEPYWRLSGLQLDLFNETDFPPYVTRT